MASQRLIRPFLLIIYYLKANQKGADQTFLFKYTRGETTRVPKRLGSETTSGAKRQGSKGLWGDTTRDGGGGGFGAKRHTPFRYVFAPRANLP